MWYRVFVFALFLSDLSLSSVLGRFNESALDYSRKKKTGGVEDMEFLVLLKKSQADFPGAN